MEGGIQEKYTHEKNHLLVYTKTILMMGASEENQLEAKWHLF